jgi:hypothetical protein
LTTVELFFFSCEGELRELEARRQKNYEKERKKYIKGSNLLDIYHWDLIEAQRGQDQSHQWK